MPACERVQLTQTRLVSLAIVPVRQHVVGAHVAAQSAT